MQGRQEERVEQVSLRRGHWWENYLPFVARSLEKQVAWILAELRRQRLAPEEIGPYITLLLEDDDPDRRLRLGELLATVDEATWTALLAAAELESLTTLIELASHLTAGQIRVVLEKPPPPYLIDPLPRLIAIYEAMHRKAPAALAEAAALVTAAGPPDHFQQAYPAFTEIRRDQEVLAALFPKAR